MAHTMIRCVLAVALLMSAAMFNLAWADECTGTPFTDAPDPTQPANLGKHKRQLLNYKCSGAYAADIRDVLTRAQAYVAGRAAAVSKAALVLDIDETSLSNWPEIVANDFGYIPHAACDLLPSGPCGADGWELSARADAIAPTRDLFNAAKAKGVAMFFITGRQEDPQKRRATETNLRRAGYDGWAELFLRSPGYASIREYKTAMRKKIADDGYTIIANVGDQESDLAGGYAEQTFKVPNPFYFLP